MVRSRHRPPVHPVPPFRLDTLGPLLRIRVKNILIHQFESYGLVSYLIR